MVDRSQSQPDLTVVALTAKSFSNWLLYGMTEDIHKDVTAMFAYQASHGSMPLRKVAQTNLDVMSRTSREELARDWSAAFALGMSSVTPHESVIRCGLTMQEPRDLTLAWMRRYGVLPDESLAEPADHLGLQLALLGLLCVQHLDATARPVCSADDIRRYVDERLAWLPDLRAYMKALDAPAGVIGMVDFLVEFLDDAFIRPR